MELIVLMFLHLYIESCWPISVSYVLFCLLFCSVLFIAGEAENAEGRVIGREFSRLPWRGYCSARWTVYKVEVGSNIIWIRTLIADHMWTSLEDNCLIRLATERGETCYSFASFCCFHMNANIHIVRSFFCMTYPDALCNQSWLYSTAGSDALQLGNVNDENYQVSTLVLKLHGTIFQVHDLEFRAALTLSSYILREVKGWCYGVRERISLKLSVLFWWSHVRSPSDVLGRGKGVRGAYIRCLNYVRHIISEV
jgi:hypothetical protein